MGEQVEAEYDTSDGRIDLLVRTDRFVYIIECKINSTARVALQQIHDKEYDLPWRIENREKVLIGLNFSTEKRRPDDWIVERGDGSVVSSSTQVSTQDGTQDEDVSTQDSTQADAERGQVRGHERGHERGHQRGHQNGFVNRLVLAIGKGTYKSTELMGRVGLKSRDKFQSNYLTPALADEYITYLYPENPKRRGQAYYLTPKGLAKLEELNRTE